MKHNFDKKRLAYVVAYASAALAMLQISMWLNDLASQYTWARYTQQLTFFTTAILTILTFFAIRKLIPRTLRRTVLTRLNFLMRKLTSTMASISKRVLRVFGFNFKRYKKNKDEKSFIFNLDDFGLLKRFQSIKNALRWRDLTENHEKIRFIYIKYVLKLIKSGFKILPVVTPNELRAEFIPEEKEDGVLIDLYNGARYSGGSIKISDEEVEFALQLVNGKKKAK